MPNRKNKNQHPTVELVGGPKDGLTIPDPQRMTLILCTRPPLPPTFVPTPNPPDFPTFFAARYERTRPRRFTFCGYVEA